MRQLLSCLTNYAPTLHASCFTNYASRLLILLCTLYALRFTNYDCAHAATGGLDIAVLNAAVGARPLGMGGAFTAVANNADAPFWNPAGLSQNGRHSEITTMQTRLSSDVDHYYVSLTTPFGGGTLGLSWIQMSLGQITRTSNTLDAFNEVKLFSIFSYFSNAYLLSYGQRYTDTLSMGITAKYLTSDMFLVPKGQASGFSITPALLYQPTPHLSLGLKVDELVNQQTWGTGTVEKAPAKARLGIAYRIPDRGLLFAADLSRILKRAYFNELSYGVEYEFNDALVIRGGYTNSNITGGVSLRQGAAEVSYAYVSQAQLTRENVHRVSLTGRF